MPHQPAADAEAVIYRASCKACGAVWRVVPPRHQTLDLLAAIDTMAGGLCPACGNDGSLAPINWRFSFGGDQEPHYGQVRAKTARHQHAPPAG